MIKGCAIALTTTSNHVYSVCYYYPAGNFVDQFQANVLPLFNLA